MGLKYEPSSEPLHMSVKQLFLNSELCQVVGAIRTGELVQLLVFDPSDAGAYIHRILSEDNGAHLHFPCQTAPRFLGFVGLLPSEEGTPFKILRALT